MHIKMADNDPFFRENVKKSFFEAKKHADELEIQIKENKRLIDIQGEQIKLILSKIDDIAQEIRKLSPKNTEKEVVPEEEKGSIHSFIHSFNSYAHPKHTIKSIIDNVEKVVNSFTKQELLAFLTIYQLEEDLKRPVTYTEISKKMELSEGCIRLYISSLIEKGAPILKQKQNNKTVFLSILEDFRNLNYKDRLVAAYYGRDPGQKRLF